MDKITQAHRMLIEAIINDYHTTRLDSDYVPHVLSKPRTRDAFARFERDLSHAPQSVEPVATHVAALVEAAKRCIQIVERHNQRQNEKVGDVKLILRSALAPFKGQDDA